MNPLNIHHLELFYHVAKNGGITAAVRKMPYGIQQPAVSAQILRLEEDLDTQLFQRRPFHLTNAGSRLFHFIAPFFEQLDNVATEIRGTKKERLRLAASGPILRDHFPVLLAAHRAQHPGLRLSLHEVNQTEAEALLQAGDIDLAITELEGKSPVGIKRRVLLKLAPAFLVPANSPWKNARQIFRAGRTIAPLIALPAHEALTRLFQKELTQREIDAVVAVEVSSLESMHTYVAGGFGFGLGVKFPGANRAPEIRALPIPKFGELILGALWRGKLSGAARSFLQRIEDCAVQFR